MQIKKFMIFSVISLFTYTNIFSTLNEFGISDIIPSHADDTTVFDQRISEELTDTNNLKFDTRHTESFTIQDILQFIANIKIYFENYLNHPDTQNPQDLELIKLAIIDVEKAKKMLKPQDVTPYEEHQLRAAFNTLKTKVNAYFHTDKIEGSSYIRS